MMNFENIDVKSGGFDKKFIDPGVHTVKFTEIKAGAAGTGTPYVELTVQDAEELTCSTRFYFAPGKNTEISVQALYSFIAVTNGFDITKDEDKVKVKATIGNFASYDDLATKLSSLLIGKQFAVVIKGKYVDNKDASKDSWVKGELSSIVTTKDKVATLKYDATKIGGTFVAGTAKKNPELSSMTTSTKEW